MMAKRQVGNQHSKIQQIEFNVDLQIITANKALIIIEKPIMNNKSKIQ